MGIKNQLFTFNDWVRITNTGIPSSKNPEQLITHIEFLDCIRDLRYVYKPLLK